MERDEAALREDLASPAFRMGEKCGRWRLARLQFPFALFEIAAPQRAASPSSFLLRLNATGYPALGPTGELWHGRRNAALTDAERPKGPSGTLIAFQNWGTPCIYHPVDRMAQDHWPAQFGHLRWGNDSDIIFYLETIHAILEDPEYLGAPLSEGALELPQEAVA